MEDWEAFKHKKFELHVADPKIHANKRKLQTAKDKIGTKWQQKKANHEERSVEHKQTTTNPAIQLQNQTVQKKNKQTLKQMNPTKKHKSNKHLKPFLTLINTKYSKTTSTTAINKTPELCREVPSGLCHFVRKLLAEPQWGFVIDGLALPASAPGQHLAQDASKMFLRNYVRGGIIQMESMDKKAKNHSSSAGNAE